MHLKDLGQLPKHLKSELCENKYFEKKNKQGVRIRKM